MKKCLLYEPKCWLRLMRTKKQIDTSSQALQSFVLPPGVRLTHPGGGPAMAFGRSGMPTLVAHKFVIAPSAEVTSSTTVLCINRTGRVRTVTGTVAC